MDQPEAIAVSCGHQQTPSHPQDFQQAQGNDGTTTQASPPTRPLAVVGLALKKEKRQKHISDRLVAQAAEAGIELRFIDKEVPLEQQGPFTAILQKVRKPDWEAALNAYAATHPEVRIFDMPAATYPLRNRGSMVSFLDGDGWVFEEPAALVPDSRPPQRCRCNVPTNTTLAAGTTYEAAVQQMAEAGLHYPLLAKPLWADGREGSHALAVIHSPSGLKRLLAGEATYLQLPVLLQQYVDHGGCLFKVYVLAETSVRVKRNSLHLPQWSSTAGAAPQSAAAVTIPQQQQQPQQQGGQGRQHQEQQQQEQQQGQQAQQGQSQAAPTGAPGNEDSSEAGGGGSSPVLPDLELMERVSAYPASKAWGRADTAPKGHGVPSPPAWLLQALAQRLRRHTGLSLFNFDVIVPMHCHRRQLHHTSSGGETGRPESGSVEATSRGLQQLQLQEAQSRAGSETRQDGGGHTPALEGLQADQGEQGEQGEEPAVLDLRLAAAQAAAAAAAAAQHHRQEGTDAAGQKQQQQDAAVAGAGKGQDGQQPELQGELLYHLIDINYFPGYEKMPNYESYMIDFLRSITAPQQQTAAVTPDQ